MMKRADKNRPLRSGYTTGACAAAAARAAAIALFEQRQVQTVQIELPGGKLVEFQLHSCVFDPGRAKCSVIKDAGDDPDVTHGAEIVAAVSFKETAGLEITGGEGVGTVTKPGLEIPIGAPAINPVPRQMITNSVTQAAGKRLECQGLVVTISVPEGKKLALKTLNARLGIIGGISILGTTGIVIPYSVSAYKSCITQALNIASACGLSTAVLTTGRRSEKFAQAELRLPEEAYIQAGDFIGFALRESVRKGLNQVFVWSMVGKMSKLAGGHMYTNVSDSEVNIGSMVKVADKCGVPEETIVFLGEAVTANHFRKLMPPEHMKRFCDELCRLAATKCRDYVSGKLEIDCVMADPDGVVLGRGRAAG